MGRALRRIEIGAVAALLIAAPAALAQGPVAPLTLAQTTHPLNPTQIVLGRLAFGEACLDGGLTSCANTPFRVYAVITTDDPYSPNVVTRISGYGQ